MVPLPFSMWVGEHQGVLTVRLAGRFEAPWAGEVQRDLLHHTPVALHLDLSGVTGIDSPALAALVAIRHDVVSGGGRFVLQGVSDEAEAMLAAAGLDALVDDEPEHPLGGISFAPPVAHLAPKGGRHERRPAAATTKVA
jgi:anti-anti-sigma factor